MTTYWAFLAGVAFTSGLVSFVCGLANAFLFFSLLFGFDVYMWIRSGKGHD